jgi:hypothetical protein
METTMIKHGFTTVLNSTETIEIIGGNSSLAAVPPLMLLAIAYWTLSRAQNQWPAVCSAVLSVACASIAYPPAAACETGTSSCVMFLLWTVTGILPLTGRVVGYARSADYSAAVREALAAHAVAWALFWMPARAGAYGAASVPRDAALLDMGPVEALLDDYDDSDPEFVAGARCATLAFQGLSALAAVHTVAESRPTRLYPWLAFGTLCVALAYGGAFLDRPPPAERTAFQDDIYACTVRSAPLCARGVMATPCDISVYRIIACGALVSLLALARRVREFGASASWQGLVLVVLYGACIATAAFCALILPIETGPSEVLDRREPHNAPCSPWGVYGTHLLAAAALSLGVGPALTCFDYGAWVAPDAGAKRVALALEKVTIAPHHRVLRTEDAL